MLNIQNLYRWMALSGVILVVLKVFGALSNLSWGWVLFPFYFLPVFVFTSIVMFAIGVKAFLEAKNPQSFSEAEITKAANNVIALSNKLRKPKEEKPEV